MEPYYTYLDVRIRKPATALADLASMVSGRLLVRPMMTERPTVAVLVDGVHKVDSVRRALEKSFSKKIVSDETLVYLADTPSGVWALLRIQDEILSLLLEFPLELDPPAVEIDDQGA